MSWCKSRPLTLPDAFYSRDFHDGTAPMGPKVDHGNGSSSSPFPYSRCRLCIGSCPSSSPFRSSTCGTALPEHATTWTTFPFVPSVCVRLSVLVYRRCCRCSTIFFSSTSLQPNTEPEYWPHTLTSSASIPRELTYFFGTFDLVVSYRRWCRRLAGLGPMF
jgi:hypothetical protein